MASFMTNRGKRRVLSHAFSRQDSLPTNFYFVLTNDTTTPTVDTNTISELTEVPNGNGYTTNGIQRAANSTNFPTLTEDDTADEAWLEILVLTWTASGGNLPASGNGARWCNMCDDNATPASREVYACIDLGANRIVSDGQDLSIGATTPTKIKLT